MFVNAMPRYEILSEDAMAHARPGLAADRLRARDRVPAARGGRAAARRRPDRRGREPRPLRPRVHPRAGRQGAAASSSSRRATPRTRRTSAATTWCSRPSTAARSSARATSAATPRWPTSRTSCGSRSSFPELDSPGGTICEPEDRPLDSRHLDMVFALQTLSDKPYMGSVTSGPNAADTIRDGRDPVRRPRGDRARAGVDLADQRQLAAALRRPDAGGDVRVRARPTRPS